MKYIFFTDLQLSPGCNSIVSPTTVPEKIGNERNSCDRFKI